VGDNIRNSHDGRAWKRVEVDFTDDTTVYWDQGLFLAEPQGNLAAEVPPGHAVFLKKSDVDPHANVVGWVVPHERIRDFRLPQARFEFTLQNGETIVWEDDLIERVDGGFLLRRRDPDTGAPALPSRVIHQNELVGIRRMAELEMTWVERRHVVGKAFAIWWPPGRWFRLIR
jgi:hypothetical protein